MQTFTAAVEPDNRRAGVMWVYVSPAEAFRSTFPLIKNTANGRGKPQDVLMPFTAVYKVFYPAAMTCTHAFMTRL